MAPRIQVIIPAEAEHYGEHEFMSPEDILECLKLNLGNNVCPSVLLELAEEFDVTPRLLESEEAAFLVPYYNLVTEIKRLIGIDDKDQFASFLIANRELVQKYSPVKVFQLICQHSAAACATALLESGLDVDVNLQFKYTGKSPLFMAARNLSYGMTKVLLDHGADADLSFSGFGTPLWNAVDAFSLLPKVTSKAKTKVLPEQKYYVEPRRSGPVLFSFVGKPVTGTSGSPSVLHFQYRTLHIFILWKIIYGKPHK
ncbi:uncharacterized protein LOC110718393 [Chenopodium quinoa]|uniref:uncharacterized protein LOC110718393 n=1 Tax=Chenopodium quinoa TaxID=63459 RepID=UPI000B78913F|nr:uncharacterized protein LOC110718393 [Chenopodium quinoa]